MRALCIFVFQTPCTGPSLKKCWSGWMRLLNPGRVAPARGVIRKAYCHGKAHSCLYNKHAYSTFIDLLWVKQVTLKITEWWKNRNEGIGVDFIIWPGHKAIRLISWFHWCGDGCSLWSKVSPTGREEDRVLSKIWVLDSAFTCLCFLPLILRAVWVKTFP